MNLNTLQKQYDKLRPEERVSALYAALARDDMEEFRTLARTAPRDKTFRVSNHAGLWDAFEWLGMFHTIMQLGEMASMYFVLFHEIDIDTVKVNLHISDDIETKTYTTDEAVELCIRRMLEGRDAWRAICAEYNLDPSDALARLPFVETIELNELTARAFAKHKNIEIDHTENLNTYRDAIAKKRAEWE